MIVIMIHDHDTESEHGNGLQPPTPQAECGHREAEVQSVASHASG